MPCQTSTNQTPQQPTTVLPQSLPQTQGDWSRFVQRLQDILNLAHAAGYTTGVNVVPTQYSLYDGTALPGLRVVGATPSLDSANVRFGGASLKLTATASTVSVTLGTSGYPITLHPLWQWISSVFLMTSRASVTSTLALVTPTKTVSIDTSGPTSGWVRLYGDDDLTADGDTSATLTLTFTGVTVGDTFNLEGWQLEPVQGNTTLPSPYIVTSPPRTWAQIVNDGMKPQDGATLGADLATNVSNNTAAHITYTSGGATVDSLKPAQVGADVTSANTAADTTAVAGVPATTVNANISTAQGTANTAQTTATQGVSLATSMAVINGGFEALPLGYGWTADSGTGWVTDSSGGTPGVGPNGAKRVAGTGSNTGAYRNNGVIGCQPGQVVKAQALCKAVGVTGTVYVYISWLNAGLGEITSTAGNQITGTTTNGSYVVAPAPAGTVYAKVCLGYSGMTAGTVYADNVVCTQQPSSLAEVPDSSTRFAAVQANADNTASNTSSDTAHVAGATAASISDGAGRAQAGFDSSGYLVNGRNNLDRIANSGSYARSIAMSGSAVVVGNANFEAPLDLGGNVPGWTPINGAVLSYNTTGAYSGAQCLDIRGGPGTSNFGAESPRYQCAAGDEVFGSVRVFPYTGSAAYMAIVFWNGASIVNSDTIGSAAFSSWNLVSKSVVAGAGATSFSIQLYNSGTNGGECFFDELQVVRKASLDNHVVDGSAYGRTSQSDLYVSGGVNRVGLRVAGSGQKIGDQRNLTQRTVTNIPARVPTVISYSAAAGTPATATISVAAFTVLAGSASIAYSAMSTSVTGTNGAVVTYYLYLNDPGFAGGTQTLIATTNVADVYGGDGYVYIGGFSLTFPASGTGSGTPPGGGGGGGCVRCDQWLPTGKRAGDIHADDTIVGTDGGLLSSSYRVDAARINDQPCWQLVTESGASVTASDSTPMTLPGGALAMFPDMLGEQVAVLREGVATWERVTQMRYVGLAPVNQISIGGNCYWAGDVPDVYISTHNTGILPK